MREGARIAAAAEILETILNRYQPVAIALADWGKAHRFAGSGDRNAIGGLVYDALRRRASIAWAFGSDTPRALAIGAAPAALALTPDEVAAQCDGSQHAPAPLTNTERAGFSKSLDDAPPAVRANIPDWLWPSFETLFGSHAVAEGEAMAMRAPADLRVNTLKATRDKVLAALQPFGAEATALSPTGLRVKPPSGPQRTPNLMAEAAFEAGWFEIQDEGSQLVALLSGAAPGKQVLDLCAGGGGKTLAMAGAMANKGQIYAYDEDRLRLKPIFERLKRAGVRNVQVLRGGDKAALEALGPRFDTVLADAPCTGTGTWRRKPDAKWRLKPAQLAERQKQQREVLARAASLVKPGGRLVYATCSVLPQENGDQIAAFVSANPTFSVLPFDEAWRAAALPGEPPESSDGSTGTLLLTPARHGTDGFFVAVLARAA